MNKAHRPQIEFVLDPHGHLGYREAVANLFRLCHHEFVYSMVADHRISPWTLFPSKGGYPSFIIFSKPSVKGTPWDVAQLHNCLHTFACRPPSPAQVHEKQKSIHLSFFFARVHSRAYLFGQPFFRCSSWWCSWRIPWYTSSHSRARWWPRYQLWKGPHARICPDPSCSLYKCIATCTAKCYYFFTTMKVNKTLYKKSYLSAKESFL